MKTALVTGAGRGLGAAIAVHLSELGYDVAIHYHSSRKSAEDIQTLVRANGRRAKLFQADLAKEAEILAMLESFGSEFGQLDLLVNNSGVYHAKPLNDLTESEWFEEINTTATATYFTTRAFLPILRKSKGRIINIGDGSCDRIGARSHSPGYHIGKTGVWILTRSFAKEEAKHGVAANMISPGLLETSVGLEEESEVPAGRHGQFVDIFAALEFLADSATPYLTGSNFIVGGGWNL